MGLWDKPPPQPDKQICPRCGKGGLDKHCANRKCDWFVCPICRSFGTVEGRFATPGQKGDPLGGIQPDNQG